MTTLSLGPSVSTEHTREHIVEEEFIFDLPLYFDSKCYPKYNRSAAHGTNASKGWKRRTGKRWDV